MTYFAQVGIEQVASNDYYIIWICIVQRLTQRLKHENNDTHISIFIVY